MVWQIDDVTNLDENDEKKWFINLVIAILIIISWA